MNEETFLKELSELKVKYNAKHFTGDPKIGIERLYLKTPEGICYCPITFVNAMKTHHYWAMPYVYEAAEELDIDDPLANKIIDAADNNSMCDLEFRSVLKSIIEDPAPDGRGLIPVSKAATGGSEDDKNKRTD